MPNADGMPGSMAMQNTPLKPKTAAPQFFCCCVPIPCGGIVLIGVVLIILLIAWLR